MSDADEGFCYSCNYETQGFDDLKKYYNDRETLNNEDIISLCCKCWNIKNIEDEFLYKSLGIEIQPLTWENHKPNSEWYAKGIKNIPMAVEVKEIQQQPIIINNNINITNTTNNNNNTTNNIKKVNKTPNYANNVYENPASNDKLNKKINKKIKADEKINFLLQMKQLDEDLEKQEIQLIKLQIEKADRDDREEEARIKQLEEDEIKRVKLENENYINKCLNSPEVLRNKQIYRAKKEKEQDDLNNIKDKYNIDFYDKNGKKQVVYQFDDKLKEIYDGIISDVKCYKCKTIKAYPNDYMTKKNKLTTSIFLKNGKEECVCAECVNKKSEQITGYMKNHEIRCKKCLNLYYCNGKDMRIEHEESENCLKMSKKRKLINGKVYGIMELRSICKLNNIKNYVRMDKIEMINTILSIENYKIPEGL